jgi:DNA (cytosine-5)-methyltransferase 1
MSSGSWKTNSAIEGIDLFSGAGGLSVGAKLAGIHVTHAVEINSAAAAAYRANHPRTVLIQTDVRNLKKLSLKQRRNVILFGGPPCQGFSTANQRTRNTRNPANWLFREFFRLARALNPDWVVLENVTGMTQTAGGKFVSYIRREFERLRYDFALWNLNAADFGVPQRRSRLFFVAVRRGRIPAAPRPTSDKPVTVRDAIADLPLLQSGASRDVLTYRIKPTSDYAVFLRNGERRCGGNLVTANNDLVLSRYRHIPPGGNWQDIPIRLMKNYTGLINNRSRHTGIYRRLIWDEPSVVIANYRKNMLVHPDQHRGLSVREAARLQSFPDTYSFAGSIGQQQQQVSNAVPPLLAKAVFEHLIANC